MTSFSHIHVFIIFTSINGFHGRPSSGRRRRGMNSLTSCVSTGTTREDELAGRKVIGLEYEAYDLMVQSEFTKLCAEVRERWPAVAHICVHHRLGSDANR